MRRDRAAKAKRNTRCRTFLGLAERVAGETASMTRPGWQAIRDSGNRNRHAALWRNSLLTDLGTLGGPNSSVTWNVKNTAGRHRGYFSNCRPGAAGGIWSSAAFYGTPNNVGFINLGFVWEHNQMRGLPNFPGGNNGFATGANNFVKRSDGRRMMFMTPRVSRPKFSSFVPAMWTLDRQTRSTTCL